MTQKPITASLEDYLEAIYKIREVQNSVRPIEISRRLGVGRASVSEALRSLSNRGLVNYENYGTLTLTSKGEKVAEAVIFKHNMLYDFFAHVLELDELEADHNSCKVEHSISMKALERLQKFMENYKKC